MPLIVGINKGDSFSIRPEGKLEKQLAELENLAKRIKNNPNNPNNPVLIAKAQKLIKQIKEGIKGKKLSLMLQSKIKKVMSELKSSNIVELSLALKELESLFEDIPNSGDNTSFNAFNTDMSSYDLFKTTNQYEKLHNSLQALSDAINSIHAYYEERVESERVADKEEDKRLEAKEEELLIAKKKIEEKLIDLVTGLRRLIDSGNLTTAKLNGLISEVEDAARQVKGLDTKTVVIDTKELVGMVKEVKELIPKAQKALEQKRKNKPLISIEV